MSDEQKKGYQKLLGRVYQKVMGLKKFVEDKKFLKVKNCLDG